MNEKEKLLINAYRYFNERNIDALLELMDPQVNWPNGWEGGYVKGHDEVREYWTRQWKEINPQVKPLKITETTDGRTKVEVEQLVKDLQGNILFDSTITHLYTISNGLIKAMEIILP